MRENDQKETRKEIMNTKEWTEMTLDNVTDIVFVAAEKLNYSGKDNIQTSKELTTRDRLQENIDSQYYSGLTISSVNRNYKSHKRKAANEIVTCVKPDVRNGIRCNLTSDSQTLFDYRPSDAMVSNSEKEQALSKIVSNRILNKEYSVIIRNEMCRNSKVPAENGQESIIATAAIHPSCLSADESSKHNKEDYFVDESIIVDKPGAQSKDTKMKKKAKGQKKICQICSRELSTSYTLQKHLKTHARDRSFTCRGCGSKFRTFKDLKSHARIHVERKIFECDHCGEKFTTKNYLVSVHLPKHSDNSLNKYQFSCSVCNRKFMSKFGFQTHSKFHIDERSYACDVCGKAFKSISGLSNHKNAHTGEDMYTCDHCGKSFPRFADLEKHIRIHTGERPFQCIKCDKRYKTYGDLAVHMRKHNPDPRFQCNICGKFCLQGRDLLNHKVIKHGESTSQENAKYNIKLPRECEICGLVSSNSSNYYRHKHRYHSIQYK